MKDEIQHSDTDAAEMALLLWRYRKWIVSCTFIASVLGIIYSLLASPLYQSEAIILPKERDQSGMGALARFGGQIPGLQNTVLSKFEIILKSRDLALRILDKHDLMPKLYPDLWDTVLNDWKPELAEEIPAARLAADELRNRISVASNSKNGTLTLLSSAGDSVFAKELLDIYMHELNSRIRHDIMSSAESDREYLQAELNNVTDPILREKMQGIIAYQFERAMLVSTQAFEVLESPAIPYMRSSPKRKRIVILAFFTGAFFSIGSIFVGRFIVAERRKLVERMRSR